MNNEHKKEKDLIGHNTNMDYIWLVKELKALT